MKLVILIGPVQQMLTEMIIFENDESGQLNLPSLLKSAGLPLMMMYSSLSFLLNLSLLTLVAENPETLCTFYFSFTFHPHPHPKHCCFWEKHVQ